MPALANVALTDTFDTWRIRTNQVIVKGNDEELKLTDAYDKANAANVLAFQTGIGANAFTSATIAGANAFTSATIAGANTAVGAGANAFTSATIAGANTAVGTGANAFSSSTIAGANTISIAAFNKANNALANTNGATFTGNLRITGTLTGPNTSTKLDEFLIDCGTWT